METQINQTPNVANDDKKTNQKPRIGLKLLIIGLICMLLLIPWFMIKSLISERQNTANEAGSEVSAKWGGWQAVAGPAIALPDTTYGSIYLMPETLDINGHVETRNLKRGIYDFTVFGTTLELNGEFRLSDSHLKRLLNDGATVAIGLNSTKGLTDNPVVEICGTTLVDGVRYENGSIICDLPADLIDADGVVTYHISLPLRGSDRLDFVPVGRTTNVSLSSDCPTPSFGGNFLPAEREVTDTGFTAHWRVLAINRSFSQVISRNRWEKLTNEEGGQFYYESESRSNFGVELRTPVEQYLQSERAVKYAYIIVLLTFGVVFFVEIRKAKPIHPVQYALIGLAIMLFYTLLLSFSEQMSFLLSYIIASVMTVGLITANIAGILRTPKTALPIGLALSALYVFIYILLQIESYALMIGSVGLFVIIGVSMYASRHINWYGSEK